MNGVVKENLNDDIRVMGKTNQREVYIGSSARNFKINEFLLIEDDVMGEILGEVVEAITYNRYLPMDVGGEFVDSGVLESMRHLGFEIDDETYFIAKLRLINEAPYPVLTGSRVVVPSFEKLRSLVLPSSYDKSMALGVLRNTADLYDGADENLKGVCKTFEYNKLHEQFELPYLFDLRDMHQYPHIGVFGGSGSGKSFGLRVILEELMKNRVPAVVLDPHYEMDFSICADGFDGVDFNNYFDIMQVGENVGIRFVELTSGELKHLLEAAAPLTESMGNAVDVLHKKNDTLLEFRSRLDGLAMAQDEGSLDAIDRRIEAETDSGTRKRLIEARALFEKYNRSVAAQSVRAILWRLYTIEREGVFLSDITKLIENLHMGKLIVVRGSTRILQVFSTYLLRKLYYLRREYKDAAYKGERVDFFPPFVMVTDEAHNFAPKGYDVPSKSIIREISQEGRKYGVFLVLATQRPTLLDETVTAQLNTKLIFRTVRASDIQTIREETDLTSDETLRLPYLRTGDVFISSASRGRTNYVRIRAAMTRSPHQENPFDELRNREAESSEEFLNRIKKYLPIGDMSFVRVLKFIEEDCGVVYSSDELKSQLDLLVGKGILEVEDAFLERRYTLTK